MTMLKRLKGDVSGLNVNVSGDALRAGLRTVWQDLKGKRLVPVAVVLLLALVAVPVLLSKSSANSAVPPVATPPPPVPGLPAVSQRIVTPAQLHRSTRDPFSAQTGGTTTTTTTAAVTAPPVATSPPVTTGTGSSLGASGGTTTTPASSGGTSPGPATGGSGSGGSPTPAGGNGSSGNGSGGQTPPPSGLTPRQSYAVRLAISNTSGGINTLDPMQRLAELPSQHQPLMVALGVLQGGDRVLFALEPGTAVSGPGVCIPGGIDCQIVSLGRNQVEHVGVRSKTGIAPVAMFAVTGISVVTHASVAAAQKARRDESAAGRALLSRTGLSALGLFHYQPNVGTVVDMRNLTFGVNS